MPTIASIGFCPVLTLDRLARVLTMRAGDGVGAITIEAGRLERGRSVDAQAERLFHQAKPSSV